MFGEERLQAVVAQNFEQNAAQLLETIHKSVTSFSGNKRFKDDLTCLVFKVDNNWETQYQIKLNIASKPIRPNLQKCARL